MAVRYRKLVFFIAATAIVAGCTVPQQTGTNSQTTATNDAANAVANNGTE